MILPKIIYIAGYGRSGSTILDIILGNHPQILSTGEICNLPDYWNNHHLRCTCGSIYKNCEVWKSAFPTGSNSASLVRKWEKLAQLPRLVANLVPDEERLVFRDYQQTLFSNLTRLSGKSFVVDSSQSSWPVAGRFLALNTLAELDVYVVHFVRNGLDSMQSIVVHGSNRTLEGQRVSTRYTAYRAPLGWTSSNLWASLLGYCLMKERYLRLYYENFILAPAVALEKIGKFCGFDSSPLIEQVQRKAEFEVGHMVGGNRVRLQRQIKLHRQLPDRRGKELLWCHHALFWFIGGFLYYHYGYGMPWKASLP